MRSIGPSVFRNLIKLVLDSKSKFLYYFVVRKGTKGIVKVGVDSMLIGFVCFAPPTVPP